MSGVFTDRPFSVKRAIAESVRCTLIGGAMRIINSLAKPGEIRSVRLSPKTVVVRLLDNSEIVYRRDGNVQTSSEDSLRRSPLHQGL